MNTTTIAGAKPVVLVYGYSKQIEHAAANDKRFQFKVVDIFSVAL